MNLSIQEHVSPDSGQAVTFLLEQGEEMHFLHPEQIIAYRGPSDGRSDRLMNIKGMYRKKKLIQADMRGSCSFTAALPPGYSVKPIELAGGSDLLYDLRHLFFYSSGITMKTRILSAKNMLISRDTIKVKFAGTGTIGVLTEGMVLEAELHPDEPLYVDAGSVIAYPENAKLDLTVYGNTLASQHMNYHFKMTGVGSVLFQAGHRSSHLEKDLSNDGLIKRVLREIIPFGGVFIK